ncbi:MAG: hypothetical protein KAV00_07085 [Phycisphaerae bacterium]|nr:hypothetical protein [Phycisphaerae bacterium]
MVERETIRNPEIAQGAVQICSRRFDHQPYLGHNLETGTINISITQLRTWADELEDVVKNANAPKDEVVPITQFTDKFGAITQHLTWNWL